MANMVQVTGSQTANLTYSADDNVEIDPKVGWIR